ncbi:hypothetical protein BJ170DRAFT_415598 [Xylariales sp. AK1849]|nr:hypothetical protein BJ170DRAFT_415598 [Xylariales sp. AK1849]
MDYFNNLEDGEPSQEALQQSYEKDRSLWLDFSDTVLQSEWWGRAWMVQELVNSKEAIFVCGDRVMREDTMITVASFPIIHRCSIWTQRFPDPEDALRRNAFMPMYLSRKLKKEGIAPKQIGEWIYQFHNFVSTGEEDRAFAYLGLAENCPLSRLKGEDWRIVYQETTRHVIGETGSIDFICLGRGFIGETGSIDFICLGREFMRDDRLPSWVPDLSIDVYLQPRLPPINCGVSSEAVLNASDGTRAVVSVSPGRGSLAIEAKKICMIAEVSLVHGGGSAVVYEYMDLAFGGIDHLLRYRSYLGKGHSYETALGRTLVWDLELLGNRCPAGSKSLFEDDEAEEIKPAAFHGIENPRSGVVDTSLDEAFRRSMAYVRKRFRDLRRFAVFERGLIGMVPADSRPGDLVLILRGATVPMIFRALSTPVPCGRGMATYSQTNYTLIGPCYLHGAMDGEAFIDDKYKLKPIIIH